MDPLEDVEEIDGSYGGPYMVEKILAIYVAKNRKKYYRVKWVDSWEPEDNLSEACQQLIDEFWSSPVHDPAGGEINRTDLKSGQKIIKKEHSKSTSEDDINPESPPDATPGNFLNSTMPTLKYDLGSPKQKTQPPRPMPVSKNLKQELMSPTETPVDNKSKDAPQSTSEGSAKPSTNNMNTSPMQHSISDTCLQTETQQLLKSPHAIKKSLSSQCVSSSTSQRIVEKKSVDCQTQTSDDEDFPSQVLSATEVNQCLTAVQTEPNVSQSMMTQTLPFETNRTMPNVQQQHHSPDIAAETLPTENSSSSLHQQQDIDAASELSFSESDVVDLASDEENDVEITLSTPSKRLCIEKQHPASTSCLEKRSREKVTQRRRRRNSEGEGTQASTAPQTRPPPILHPRSLLPMMPGNTRPNPAVAAAPQLNIQRPSVHSSGRKRPLNLPAQATNNAPDNNNMQNKLTDRTCNICKHTFPNLTQARQHFKRVHVSTSTTANSGQAVSTTAASNPRNKNQTSDLTCHICFAFFRNNRDLKSHMLLHTETNLQKCDICLRTFKHRSTLQQHMLIHSDELPHKCETCGKRFRQQGHLIVHMAKHTRNNEGTLVCPHCSMEFSDNIQFRSHVRSHESELPFQCSQCQERFQVREDLMRHLEGHNEGRPFTCPTCKKSFKTKTYLYGHMQMHKVRENGGRSSAVKSQNE